MYLEIGSPKEPRLLMATRRHCWGCMMTWGEWKWLSNIRADFALVFVTVADAKADNETERSASTDRTGLPKGTLMVWADDGDECWCEKDGAWEVARDDDNIFQHQTVLTVTPNAVQVDLIPTVVTTAMQTTSRDWSPCRDLRRWKHHRK